MSETSEIPQTQTLHFVQKRSKTAAPRFSVDFFTQENPRSLINIVPGKLREALLDPSFPRHWLDIEEGVLKQKVESFVDERDSRLRLLFWDEYNAAQDEKRMILMERVFAGACSNAHFYSRVIKDQHKLVWMLTPPAPYEVSMRELLQMSLGRLREILTLPIMMKGGRPDIGLIKEIVKIHALVDNRVQGAVKQTLDINQKSLNIDMKAKGAIEYDPAEQEITKIDAEIQSLQMELSQDARKIEKEIDAHPEYLVDEADEVSES